MLLAADNCDVVNLLNAGSTDIASDSSCSCSSLSMGITSWVAGGGLVLQVQGILSPSVTSSNSRLDFTLMNDSISEVLFEENVSSSCTRQQLQLVTQLNNEP